MIILLLFSSHCSTQNIGFSNSGYIIQPPQPSSTIYRAPPFTGHLEFIFKMAKRHADVALSKKLENEKNYPALLKCSQHCCCQTTQQHLSQQNAWIKKIEWPCSIILHHRQLMRKLILDVFVWKWILFYHIKQRKLLVICNHYLFCTLLIDLATFSNSTVGHAHWCAQEWRKSSGSKMGLLIVVSGDYCIL